MTTYYLVLQLLSTLKQLFPARWASVHRDIPRTMGAEVCIRLYKRRGGERDVEAEKMLATYAALFGLRTVNPAWYSLASAFALEPGTDEPYDPLLLAGASAGRVDQKVRHLLDAGIPVRLRPDNGSPPAIALALLRNADLRQARLDAWRVTADEFLKNEQRVQGNFRGARPLDALIRLLPVIDVVASRFDDAQMAAILEALANRDDCYLYANGIVRNRLCSWASLEKLERYAAPGNSISRVLCQAVNVIPAAYVRFAQRVTDEDLDPLLATEGLHPSIRPHLAARRLQLGPEAWRHLIPSSLFVETFVSPRTLRELLPERSEQLAAFRLLSAVEAGSAQEALEVFPGDALSDTSVWREKSPDAIRLCLYWLFEEKQLVAYVVENGVYAVAAIEHAAAVFGVSAPDLMIRRAEEKRRCAENLRFEADALTKAASFLGEKT